MINLITALLGVASTVLGFFFRKSQKKEELEKLYHDALAKYDRDLKDYGSLKKEVDELKEKLKKDFPNIEPS